MLTQIRLKLSINAWHPCGIVAHGICGAWEKINNPVNAWYTVANNQRSRTQLLRNGKYPC